VLVNLHFAILPRLESNVLKIKGSSSVMWSSQNLQHGFKKLEGVAGPQVGMVTGKAVEREREELIPAMIGIVFQIVYLTHHYWYHAVCRNEVLRVDTGVVTNS
jgi:hypothetical protein